MGELIQRLIQVPAGLTHLQVTLPAGLTHHQVVPQADPTLLQVVLPADLTHHLVAPQADPILLQAAHLLLAVAEVPLLLAVVQTDVNSI